MLCNLKRSMCFVIQSSRCLRMCGAMERTLDQQSGFLGSMNNNARIPQPVPDPKSDRMPSLPSPCHTSQLSSNLLCDLGLITFLGSQFSHLKNEGQTSQSLKFLSAVKFSVLKAQSFSQRSRRGGFVIVAFYWFDGSSTEKETLSHFGKACKTTSV